jgi:hypothetical protein
MEHDDVKVLQQRLAAALNKIPLGVQHGSWNAAREFKKWVGEAKKGMRSTSVQVLTSLLNRYEAF